MYAEGIGDLTDLISMYFFSPPENKQKSLSNIEQKAKERFLPVFEKVLIALTIHWPYFEAFIILGEFYI